MGYGIELMVATVSGSLPGLAPVSVLPSISGYALLLMVLGGLWLCLWQTRMRALGLVIAAFGLTLAPVSRAPDILIDRDGKTVALRERGRTASRCPPATRTDYSTENWLLADGDDRDVAAQQHRQVLSAATVRDASATVKGKTIALVRHPSALEEDCRLADIVVAPFTVTKACRAARVVVDRQMLKEHGASRALYRRPVDPLRDSRRGEGDRGPGCRSVRHHAPAPRSRRRPRLRDMATPRSRERLERADPKPEREDQYRRIRPTSRPCTRTRSGPKMRVS